MKKNIVLMVIGMKKRRRGRGGISVVPQNAELISFF